MGFQAEPGSYGGAGCLVGTDVCVSPFGAGSGVSCALTGVWGLPGVIALVLEGVWDIKCTQFIPSRPLTIPPFIRPISHPLPASLSLAKRPGVDINFN